MSSQSASKTPTKQRNSWTLVEEKEFLILCREWAIAEQLDNCVTSAGGSAFLNFKHRPLSQRSASICLREHFFVQHEKGGKDLRGRGLPGEIGFAKMSDKRPKRQLSLFPAPNFWSISSWHIAAVYRLFLSSTPLRKDLPQLQHVLFPCNAVNAVEQLGVPKLSFFTMEVFGLWGGSFIR
ncbi:uncharacterized protein [Montipora foliosa]|uniref:uncharacterized protein n=1 Tax=Montipora foliosa TaxID=591990 RepID=UPI0035F156B3